MKNIKLLAIALIVVGITVVGCKKEATDNTTSMEVKAKSDKPVAEAKKATMKIEGITCSIGFAKTIENKLAGLDGVQKATVDFDKKEATIEYDAQVQSIETLSKTIEEVADGKTYKVKDAKNI